MPNQPLNLDAIEGALPDGGLPAAWLDAIRTRYAAAEGGGWHLDPEPHTDPDTVRTTISGYHHRIGVLKFSAPYADENRAFVLHAHGDVGVLIAEIRRLRSAAQSAAVLLRSIADRADAGRPQDTAAIRAAATALDNTTTQHDA
jgi:hypothetical protein